MHKRKTFSISKKKFRFHGVFNFMPYAWPEKVFFKKNRDFSKKDY